MNAAHELIASEHREVESLFERFQQAPDREVARQICELLERHTDMEEEVLYPDLEQVDQELYDDAKEEHEQADEIIGQIKEELDGSGDLDRISELISELRQEVQHHVDDEESEDLPAMERELGAARMDELGQQMQQWEQGGSRDGASEKDALLDLTKDELYEKAQDADIEGRSSMSKEQLAEELAQS